MEVSQGGQRVFVSHRCHRDVGAGINLSLSYCYGESILADTC